MYRLIISSFILAILFTGACKRSGQGSQNAADNTNKIAELATDPEQQRLWRAAMEKNNQANTLGNVPVPGDAAVQNRAHPTMPNQQLDGKPQPLPPGMAGGARFIKTPNLEGAEFRNAVRVKSVEGEQIELDLGGPGTLSFYARARGGPIRATAGDTAQLDYRFRDDPFDRQRILALRLGNGDGIVSALDSGDKPVTISIPLFELTASQTGGSERNAMSVTVTVGGEQKVLAPGQIVDFERAGVTVGIIGSAAFVGDEAPRAEGRPYALNIVAWPTK